MAISETPIPIPDANASFLMNFFTSRDNNSDPETNVGQQARLWWNPQTNLIYVSDGVTPGGIPVGGGGGAGNPAAPFNSVQFNNQGVFGGSANLTWDGNILTANAISFTNALYVGNTLFTRTLTVGRATTPVTVPLASNNSFNVLAANGDEITVYTT